MKRTPVIYVQQIDYPQISMRFRIFNTTFDDRWEYFNFEFSGIKTFEQMALSRYSRNIIGMNEHGNDAGKWPYNVTVKASE